ncbi:uncharacterized protein LOC130744419, partial [Lotus japonicus]|uniref:uncharacterized protein LOC130744419 n=1 Tax=Lotus japonicus TaxID=34305 RepID=UPI00258F0290
MMLRWWCGEHQVACPICLQVSNDCQGFLRPASIFWYNSLIWCAIDCFHEPIVDASHKYEIPNNYLLIHVGLEPPQITFGYTVDCVDIKKQPAFDHPLLRNHKLQRKPSFQNIMGKADERNSSAKLIGFGLEKNQCPVGTVPIRRTTKEELIRGKSLFNYPNLTSGQLGTHIAEVTYGPFGFRRFYGASGMVSVWNPRVNQDQTSASHMWVQNGYGDGTNKITVGWHSDNFKKTGCYNLHCPGFVQINREHD